MTINFFFVGVERKVYYNNDTGLYNFYRHDNNMIQINQEVDTIINFKDILCLEPLLIAQINNEKVCYFKSAPLEYY